MAMQRDMIEQMQRDWDSRAAENARHHVQNAEQFWDEREFFRTGEINVANDVMPEMLRICGGTRSPRDLHALEIGCGVGRMTRMLATIFGRVTAVDISEKMLIEARKNLADLTNVSLILGDGCGLAGVQSEEVDFAFSFIVFQHVPDFEVIRSYCKEVFRVLKPGAVFKFQAQGSPAARREVYDTWNGVPVSLDEAENLAKDCGFLLEAHQGEGTQYFWLVYRKPRP